MNRRHFLRNTGLLGMSGLLGWAPLAYGRSLKQAHVVVVGGGFGGATAAKYLRLFSQGLVRVTLIEPNRQLVSCPLSNLVIGGSAELGSLSSPYGGLSTQHGVQLVHDHVQAIDAERRQVRLSNGQSMAYDRLIVSPGIDFMWDQVEGLETQAARQAVPHAWKAGPQTELLRDQLQAMPDGGVFAISIPPEPYRCPPGPYERICQVAWYLKQHKPRSKVLVFDANADIVSKKGLFRQAWQNRYEGLIDYQSSFNVQKVDAATRTLTSDMGEQEKADVLNVLPPMRAGDIAVQTGLANANGRWCEVDFLTFESVAIPGVHVLGDAILLAPGMPKSAHMANQHGKTCAAAIVALLAEQEVNSLPIYANTCYSFVSNDEVVHVSSVHRYDAEKATMLPVAGAGGLSSEATKQEGAYAWAWARNIWADALA